MTEEEKAAQEVAQGSATTVAEVEFDNLDDLLGIPSASSVIAPSETKPSVLKSNKVDISFLDEIKDDDTESLQDPEVAKAAVSALVDTPLLDETDDEEEEAGQVNKGGRPKLVKDAMVEAATRLIDKGVLQPFDDGKALADYTVDDFEIGRAHV